MLPTAASTVCHTRGTRGHPRTVTSQPLGTELSSDFLLPLPQSHCGLVFPKLEGFIGWRMQNKALELRGCPANPTPARAPPASKKASSHRGSMGVRHGSVCCIYPCRTQSQAHRKDSTEREQSGSAGTKGSPQGSADRFQVPLLPTPHLTLGLPAKPQAPGYQATGPVLLASIFPLYPGT